MQEASWVVRGGMLVLPLLVALGFVFLMGEAAARAGTSAHAARLRAALGVGTWMLVFALVARSGVLLRMDLRPPPFALMVLAIFTGALWLGLGPVGARFARELPLSWLVGSQIFRLPLELVMHRAATEHVMPNEMSYSGYNFDIVTGGTAVLVALAASYGRAPRWLVLGWNVLGTALLFNIVTIALLATPMVHAFGTHPHHLNTWVAHFPYVWLPTVLVAFALFGHVVIFRALRAQRRT